MDFEWDQRKSERNKAERGLSFELAALLFETQAVEDEDAWTEQELKEAQLVYPPPFPEQVRAVRVKLGLSQVQFARRFGFSLDAVQQYEQGRRRPSGPAATLLRVIEAEPDAVARALQWRKAG